jgi:hypothetical protein
LAGDLKIQSFLDMSRGWNRGNNWLVLNMTSSLYKNDRPISIHTMQPSAGFIFKYFPHNEKLALKSKTSEMFYLCKKKRIFFEF